MRQDFEEVVCSSLGILMLIGIVILFKKIHYIFTTLEFSFFFFFWIISWKRKINDVANNNEMADTIMKTGPLL